MTYNGSSGKSAFLELGAGVAAMPTITLRRMGKYAMATDIVHLVNDISRNIKENDYSQVRCFTPAVELTWATKTDEYLEECIDKIHSQFDAIGGMQVIILADCIYSETSAEALCNTLFELCKRGKSLPEILCMSEVRNQEAQDKFLYCCGERGFVVEIVSHDEWHCGFPDAWRFDFVNLYRITLFQL